MTPFSILLIVSTIFFIALILLLIRILIKDMKIIKTRSVQLRNIKKVDRNTGAPITLNRENWAQFEGGVPNLKEVILLLDQLDQPSGELLSAIMKNLKRKVKYYFYVSSPKRNRDIVSFTLLFKGIVDSVIAKEEFAFGPEELFKIIPLKIHWNNVPYVFYRFADPKFANKEEKGYDKTVGFRGDVEGVGIASQYTIINAFDAEAIAKLLSEAIVDEHKPMFHTLREGEFEQPQIASEFVKKIVTRSGDKLQNANN